MPLLSDVLSLVLQFITFLWPCKIVAPWEKAIYTVGGRIVRPWRIARVMADEPDGTELGPGLYLTIPWLCEVHEMATSWDYITTERLDITLKDGRKLTCRAIAKVRLTNAHRAYVAFHDYGKDLPSMLETVVSDLLQEADPERFEPAKRGRLLGSTLLNATQKAGGEMGHEVESVHLPVFVLEPRIYRILT